MSGFIPKREIVSCAAPELWFWKEATVARDIQVVTVADHDPNGEPPTATVAWQGLRHPERWGRSEIAIKAEVYLLGTDALKNPLPISKARPGLKT
jgi:hypothetical protein